MAHLNEDGLRHLLKKLVSTFGTNDISNSVQKAIEIIVTKDPRGHGIYKGNKYLLPEEFQNQYGIFATPTVEIPFYTDSFSIGAISFTSDDGVSVPLSLSESGSIMTNTPQDSLGFCPGTLNIKILNNDKVVEEVSSDFTINPIILETSGTNYINSEHQDVIGAFNGNILLKTTDLGYRGSELGEFSEVRLPSNITYVNGSFFMNTNINYISIADGSSRYTSTDPETRSNINCILDLDNKLIVVGSANSNLSSYSVAHNNSEEWTLASGSFAKNHAVNSIYIPSYIKHVESGAFYNCPNLNQVTYQGIWDEFQNACGGDPYVAFQYDEGGHCVQIYTEVDGQYNDLCF